MKDKGVFSFFQSGFVWLVFIFISLPILAIIYLSFSSVSFFEFPPSGFSLRWYENLTNQPKMIEAFIRSLFVAIVVVIIAIVISLPIALGIARLNEGVAEKVLLFFLGPLLIPELVLALGLLQLYTIIGWLDTIWGLIIAQVVIVIPYMTRSVLVSVIALDKKIIEASTLLGASKLYTFRRVTMPMLRPGVLAGCIFSFIISFDQFTISLFIVSNKSVTLPVAIYNYLFYQNDPTIAAVSTLSILIGVVAVLLINRMVGLDLIAKR